MYVPGCLKMLGMLLFGDNKKEKKSPLILSAFLQSSWKNKEDNTSRCHINVLKECYLISVLSLHLYKLF